ncbi:hypothetical protein EE612_020405, partial [Oryza sativa]
ARSHHLPSCSLCPHLRSRRPPGRQRERERERIQRGVVWPRTRGVRRFAHLVSSKPERGYAPVRPNFFPSVSQVRVS